MRDYEEDLRKNIEYNHAFINQNFPEHSQLLPKFLKRFFSFYEICQNHSKIKKFEMALSVSMMISTRSCRILQCIERNIHDGYYTESIILLRALYENNILHRYLYENKQDCKPWLFGTKKFEQQKMRKYLNEPNFDYKFLSNRYAHVLDGESVRDFVSLSEKEKRIITNVFPTVDRKQFFFSTYMTLLYGSDSLKILVDWFKKRLDNSEVTKQYNEIKKDQEKWKKYALELMKNPDLQ